MHFPRQFTLSSQLKRGGEYATLKPVIGINLLDFNLFENELAEDDLAHWHFQFRHQHRCEVVLDTLQLHVLELRKLDRLRGSQPGTLADWVTYFKHWHEDTAMSEIRHPPVQKALEQLKSLSQDNETYWQAVARERALLNETHYLAHARETGLKEGLQKGRQEGLQEGRQEGLQEGRQEGLQEGRQDGRAEVLARQLALKFGDLPPAIQQRLDQATPSELDAWTERVLFADSLDEVFTPP